jgi:hypothetical protein
MEQGTRFERRCGPKAGKWHKRIQATIAPVEIRPNEFWYVPTVQYRNESGFVQSTVRGSVRNSVVAAKREAQEMLDDECRSRGFGGGLSGLRGHRRPKRTICVKRSKTGKLRRYKCGR